MRVNKGSASYIILTILEKTIDGYVQIQDFAYNPGIYAYWGGRQPQKSALSQALNRLKKGGFVDQVRLDEQKVIIKLTDSGRDLIGWGKDDAIWDGKWRIVSFDIPEQKRVIRNLFRRNLKKWGFKYLHKSVWISKNNFYDKLTKYIKELGIEKWVTVIEADKVSDPSLSK